MQLRAVVKNARHYWISAVVVAVVAAVAVAVVDFVTTRPAYTTNADIVFNSQAFESFNNPDAASAYTTAMVQTYSNYLQSPSVLGPVARSIDPGMNAANLKQGIEFTPGPGLLQLSYETDDPTKGAKVMRALTAQVRLAVEQTTAGSRTPAIGIAKVSIGTAQVSGTNSSVPRSTAIGLLIGIVIALIYLFLRALLDTRVRDVEAVIEVTDASVLAALPSRLDESTDMSALAHNLGFVPPRDGARSVLITSSVPGEGAGAIGLRAADAMAGAGSVVLVDADLRGHEASGLAGVNGRGLSDVLAGRADAGDVVVQRKGAADLLPAGSAVGNPAELLAADALGTAVAGLAARYDTVIVTAAPVRSGSDSLLVAPQLAATVPVIGLGRVTRGSLSEALELLDAGGARIGGVVLTGVSRPASATNPYAPLANAAAR